MKKVRFCLNISPGNKYFRVFGPMLTIRQDTVRSPGKRSDKKNWDLPSGTWVFFFTECFAAYFASSLHTLRLILKTAKNAAKAQSTQMTSFYALQPSCAFANHCSAMGDSSPSPAARVQNDRNNIPVILSGAPGEQRTSFRCF